MLDDDREPLAAYEAIPKYSDVHVRLSETDGNAFAIVGLCRKAARDAGVPAEEIRVFAKEAISADYNHMLRTCMKWFDVI